MREFFQAMQCRGNLARLEEMFREGSRERLDHETEIVIAAHFGDKLLFQQVDEGMSMRMCKALRDLRREEREIGRQEGLDESLIIRILDCTKEELVAAK